ncbi:MAG: hypothetical protein GXO79_13485 [Chlorobi bacterium]|nr:hypothetical protein [Chlorobiota bacterium]
MIQNLNILLIIINLFGMLFFLVWNKGNRISNVFFAILLLLFSWQILFNFLIDKELISNYIELLGADIPFIYLIPPVYYYLIKSFFRYNIKFRLREVSHIILFLAAFSFLLPLFFIASSDKQDWVEKSYNQYIAIKNMTTGIFYAQFFIYVYIVLKYLRNILFEIKKISWVPKKLIARIKMFSYFTLIYLLIQIAILLLLNNPKLKWLIPVLQFGIIVFLINILMNPKENEQLKAVSAIISDSKKYGTENLSESEKEDILKMISNYLYNEKPIHATFTQADLANNLLIPAHHLAEAIYSKYENGFVELIEDYRFKKD